MALLLSTVVSLPRDSENGPNQRGNGRRSGVNEKVKEKATVGSSICTYDLLERRIAGHVMRFLTCDTMP
jgi:hypothetical protein